MKNRRHCVTQDLGQFAVSVGYDPDTGKVCEVFFTDRGKSGTELESTLYDVGVFLSKALQGETWLPGDAIRGQTGFTFA